MNLLVIFDPELGNEYEYSNDSEDLDDDGEKEKDKTFFEMLKYCLESIKSGLISPVKYLIEYNDNHKKQY